jgi:hypothetical protein
MKPKGKAKAKAPQREGPPPQHGPCAPDRQLMEGKSSPLRVKRFAEMFPPKPPKNDPEARGRIAKAFGRPTNDKPLQEPPASESMFWRPKGERPQEDASWLLQGNLGEKR